MQIKNRAVSLGFKSLMIVVCLWGLYLNSGMTHGKFVPQMFCYYTILDNTAALLFGVFAVIKVGIGIKNTGVIGSVSFSRFKGALTMMLTYLFVSYHFFLLPQVVAAIPDYQILTLDNVLVHYITPFLVILDWLLFDEKNQFKWYDPILWLIFPIAYYVFILLRAEFGDILHGVGSRYPYDFVDVDIHGFSTVIMNMLRTIILHTVCGYAIFVVDKLLFLPAAKSKSNKTGRETTQPSTPM